MQWPDNISISDGELRDSGGALFPSLNTIWNEVEDRCVDDISDLMTWAIFASYHRAAISHLKAGDQFVSKSDIDLEYTHYKFNESFYNDEGDWSEYHSTWIDDYKI